MKKLLFLILIVFCFSCKKESCYQCKMTIVTTVPGYPTAGSTTTVTTEQCGLTVEAIKAYEKAGTSTTTVTMSGIAATAKSTTVCTK